jgi:hypothetical protein
MAEFTADAWSTKRLYREIQGLIGGRLLVDKSPHYALDPGALAKAERDFDRPFYLHLVRHPYSMTRSFEKYHMNQILYLKANQSSTRQLGELAWVLSHRNILDFLRSVPADRTFRILYEDLVTRPREVMTDICDRFGLAFHEGLVDPYGDLGGKMTDGLYAASTPMGDTNLLERHTIDPNKADSWRGVVQDNFLGAPTWALADQFGYESRADLGLAEESRPDRPSAQERRRRRMKERRRKGSA